MIEVAVTITIAIFRTPNPHIKTLEDLKKKYIFSWTVIWAEVLCELAGYNASTHQLNAGAPSGASVEAQ